MCSRIQIGVDRKVNEALVPSHGQLRKSNRDVVEMHHMTALFHAPLTETRLDIQNLAKVSTTMMTLIIKNFPK
jgi:hypothetical protein